MIKGLTDRGLALPIIGNIRKGGPKDPNKNQPGPDLKYFRIDIDAEEEKRYGTLTKFVNAYGQTPNAITVLLPFDDIDRVWDAWREKYSAGAMIHRCDGEMVKYSLNPATGERVVVNGLRVDTGQPEPCKIQHLPKPQCCVPVGRLKVIIPALNRMAYLVVHTTSIWDVISISEQLEAIKGLNGGHIAGVPLVLKRTPREISTPSGSDSKRARRTKYLISIEADPSWVEQKILALNSAAMPQIESRKPLSLNAGQDLEALDALEDDDEEITPTFADPSADEATGYQPVFEPIAAGETEQPAQTYRMSKVKFDGMTPDQWHALADKFCADNPNWQNKQGQSDMNHVLASAGKAGYEYITANNVDDVFAAIISKHAAKPVTA
jgi:hypothetical protein